ncbi:hypothetical protein DRP77_05975, partial [Candidatus Poribacteria bacterium]
MARGGFTLIEVLLVSLLLGVLRLVIIPHLDIGLPVLASSTSSSQAVQRVTVA